MRAMILFPLEASHIVMPASYAHTASDSISLLAFKTASKDIAEFHYFITR